VILPPLVFPGFDFRSIVAASDVCRRPLLECHALSRNERRSKCPFVFSGNVGDRDGHLQDGGFGHEDAGGRVDAGEEDRQDFPSDGQEHGRQIVARRIY